MVRVPFFLLFGFIREAKEKKGKRVLLGNPVLKCPTTGKPNRAAMKNVHKVMKMKTTRQHRPPTAPRLHPAPTPTESPKFV